MKNIRIEISDTQHSDETSDSTLMSTFGTIERKEDGFLIYYTEQDGELAGCDTTLDFTKNYVTITRSGSFKYDLVLEKNKRHSCHYATPYGSFILGLYATEISCIDKDTSIDLNLKYDIDYNSDLMSKNELRIKARELS